MIKPVYNPEWPELVKSLYAHDMQEMWDPSILPHIYNMYHDELLRYINLAGAKPLRILDVGCAQGTLALLLAEAGHHVTAFDLRSEFLDYAKSRYEKGDIRFVQGNVLELSLADEFDLIYANQILEHLVYPVEMVKGLAKRLAPGGRMVVTTPSGDYIKSSLPLFHEIGDPAQYKERQFFPDGDGHFFAYSRTELQEIFLKAGLSKVTVTAYGTPWITGHLKFRYLHGRIPLNVLCVLDRIVLKLPWISRMLGYQLMATGSKPR